MKDSNTMLSTTKNYCTARYARGSVWWINLPEDSLCPNRQKGERPVLIYSGNVENNRGNFVAVMPLSSSESNEPYVGIKNVKINYEGTSYILANQIFMVNSDKFKSYYFTVSEEVMEQVEYVRMKADGIAHKYTKNSIIANNLNIVKVLETLFNKTAFTTNAENTVEDNKNIDFLYAKIDELTNTVNELTIKRESINNENNRLKQINAALSEQCNKAHEKINVLSNKSNNTDNNKDTTKNRKKRISGLPIGFWKSIDNNIEFWNNYINNGVEWCMNKYDYDTITRLKKRKSHVRCMLKNAGYNVRDGIMIRKNNTLS